MLKQYSAACTRFTYKMDLITLMLVVVEKAILYIKHKSKTKLFSNKNINFSLNECE